MTLYSPPPPASPAGKLWRVRPEPKWLALHDPIDVRGADLGSQAQAWLERHRDDCRDLAFYADHARIMGENGDAAHWPKDLQDHLVAALTVCTPVQGACYYNALMLGVVLREDHEVAYCEGVVVQRNHPGVIQHAWLLVDGYVFDPTNALVAKMGLGAPEDQVHVGCEWPVQDVAQVFLKESWARPYALGPARSKKQQRIEDQEWLAASSGRDASS